jgi:hypothetical protein
LVNSRAESGYPERGIKMPSRDSQNVIVSLQIFYKTITKWFSKQDSVIGHALGMLLACGSSIFTLSESLATSLVHGPRTPARKTIRYSFFIEHVPEKTFLTKVETISMENAISKLRLNKALKFEEKNLFKENVLSE